MILDVGVGTTCPLFASIYSPPIDIYFTMPILSFIGGTSETHSIFARGAPDYFLCPLIVVRVSITLQKPVHPLIPYCARVDYTSLENSDFSEDERQPSTIHGYRNKPQTHLITLPPPALHTSPRRHHPSAITYFHIHVAPLALCYSLISVSIVVQ